MGILDKYDNLQNSQNDKLERLSAKSLEVLGAYDADSPIIPSYTNPVSGKIGNTSRLTGDGYYVNAPELKIDGNLNPAGINARIQADNYAMGVDAPNFPQGEGLDPQYYDLYKKYMDPAIADRSASGKYNVVPTGGTGVHGRPLVMAQSDEMPMSQTDYLLGKEQGKRVNLFDNRGVIVPKVVDPLSGKESSGVLKEATQEYYSDPTNRYEGVVDRAGNVVKGLVSTAGKTLISDTADWVAEATGLGDLGTEQEKSDYWNKLTGYDQTVSAAAMQDIKKNATNIYEAMTTNKELDFKDVADAVTTAIKTPELAGESIGFLLGTMVGAGKFTKVGKAVSEIGKMKGLTAAQKVDMVNDVKKSASVLDNAKKLVADNVGLLNVSAGMTNNQIDDFKVNNNGESPSFGEVARMMGLNVVLTGLDRMTFKDIASIGSTIRSKEKVITDIIAGIGEQSIPKVVSAVAKKTGEIALDMGKEAAQEYSQSMGELLNKQWGTEKYGDFIDIVRDPNNQVEAITGALAGAGGAVQFKAPGLVKDTFKGTGEALFGDTVRAKNAKDLYNDDTVDFSTASDVKKKEHVQATLDYVTLAMVDPETANESGKTGGELIDDAVDRLAKIHGLSDEAKKYGYDEVINGIKSTIMKHAGEVATTKDKLSIFKSVVDSVKGNKDAEVAAEDALQSIVAEETADISKKFSDAYKKNVDFSQVKLTDADKAKLESLISDMKEMGSEEMTDVANRIDTVLKGLGKKKTAAEVANDIKTAGFIYFGKAYKSLAKHERDVLKDETTGEDKGAVSSLEKFAKQRGLKKVNFSTLDESGKVVERNVGELRSFSQYVVNDNKAILETVNSLLGKVTNEDTVKRLQASKKLLEDSIANYEYMLGKGNSLESFKKAYNDVIEGKIEGKTDEVVASTVEEDIVSGKELTPTQRKYMATQVAVKIYTGKKDFTKEEEQFRANYPQDVEKVLQRKAKMDAGKKPEVKVEVKVEEPAKVTETEAQTDVEYYQMNLEASIKSFNAAKKALKDINGPISILKKRIDAIKTEKDVIINDIKGIKDDLVKAQGMIRDNLGKLNKLDRSALTAIGDILVELKRLVRNAKSRIKYWVKKKLIKELELEEAYLGLKALDKELDNAHKQLTEMYGKKDEIVSQLKVDKADIKEMKAMIKDAKSQLFQDKYESTADKFKSVDEDKVSVVYAVGMDSTVSARDRIERNKQIDAKTEVLSGKLLGLMPRSVKKMIEKKPGYLTDAVRAFVAYRNGDGETTDGKIEVPVQTAGVLSFINDWKKEPALNERLHLALDVAGIVTMNDMVAMRAMPSNLLDDVVTGAFGITSDDPMMKVVKRDIQKGKYVPMSTFTLSAGKRVIAELGLQFDNTKVSMQQKQDIQNALGQIVIERAKAKLKDDKEYKANDLGVIGRSVYIERDSSGTVSNFELLKGYKEGIDTNDTRRVVTFEGMKNTKLLRQMSSILEYASEQSDGEISFEPVVLTKKKVRNRSVEMSDEDIAYINKNNSIAWSFNDDFKKMYNEAKVLAEGTNRSVNDVFYKMTLDEVEDIDTKLASDVESSVAKMEAEKLEIDRMLMAYELAGDQEFYLSWDKTGSDRFMIDNRMINPQNSKISRFLISTNDMKSTLSKVDGKYDESDIAVIKGAIAQAFGIGIDKVSDVAAFKELGDSLVDISEDGTKIVFTDKRLESAVKLYNKGKVLHAVKQLKEIGVETNELYHAVQSLQVLNGLVNKEDSIDHGLLVEVDAITNGMILTALEEGSKESMELIAKGGIYWGSDYGRYKNHGEYKEAGGLDVYQTPIDGMLSRLKGDSLITRKVLGLLNGKDGKPDMDKWRKTLKPLVMVYIYGAGMKSIVNKAGEEFGTMLLKDIVKNKDVKSLTELFVSVKGLDVKDLLYVDKNKIVAGKDYKAVKGTLSKETIGNVYLTPYQEYLLNKAITEEFGEVISESFMESFPQIDAYRKALKSVSVLQYVAFMQELNKKVDSRESITIAEVNKILDGMKDKGLFYGNMTAHNGLQEYIKFENYDSHSVEVTGFNGGKAAKGVGATVTVNSALKWFASNVGAIGVIDIHSKDGRAMMLGNKDGSLSIYDALMLAANYEKASKNTKDMNKAVIDVSREHSALASLVENVSKILDSINEDEMTVELTKNVQADMARIFATEDVPSNDIIKTVGETLKRVRDGRNGNVSGKMLVNHVYALDSLDGVEVAEGEVRSIELDDKGIDAVIEKLQNIVNGNKAYSNYLETVKRLEGDYKELSKDDLGKISKELMKKANKSLDDVVSELLKGCKDGM